MFSPKTKETLGVELLTEELPTTITLPFLS